MLERYFKECEYRKPSGLDAYGKKIYGNWEVLKGRINEGFKATYVDGGKVMEYVAEAYFSPLAGVEVGGSIRVGGKEYQVNEVIEVRDADTVHHLRVLLTRIDND